MCFVEICTLDLEMPLNLDRKIHTKNLYETLAGWGNDREINTTLILGPFHNNRPQCVEH